jgi:Spy/CpxP family protein refolding chaperone
MLSKSLTLLLVFSLAFNIAFLAIWVHNRRARVQEPAPPVQQTDRQGRDQSRGPGRGTRPPGDELWDKLGVSSEQKKLLDESHARLAAKTEELRQEARTHREKLYELMGSELPDEAAVYAEQEAIDRIEQQQRRAVIEQMLEMRKILNPAQRREWLQMMQDFRERGRRRGRSGGPRAEGSPGAGPEAGEAPMEPGPMPQGERSRPRRPARREEGGGQ